MPLKFKLDDLNGLEKPIADLYVQNDEDKKFYLGVEGVVSAEKLSEFRDNNIKLTKDLGDVMAKYKDVDVDKYRTLLKMEADGKFSGKTNEEIDKIINERVGNMKTEYETKIGELEKNNGVQASQLNILLVDNVVRDAASKAGISGPAIDDVLLRAKATFRLVDGKPIPHDERGNVIYSNDGTTPLSVNGWVASLKKTAAHLFPVSQGGGAQGGQRGTAGAENMTSLQKISTGLQEANAK